MGWCHQSNWTKVDKPDFIYNNKSKKSNLTVFNTDSIGSRVCSNPSGNLDISFYGDGYCMCRNVHDKETFPWYLGKLRGTRVSNYGVNSYGLDQSLLLLQRNYNKDPSKIVILTASPFTMAYCSSIYLHYLAHENVLAVKPHFQINDLSNEIELIKNPIKSKFDFFKFE